MITLLVVEYVYESRKMDPNCGSEAHRIFTMPNLGSEKNSLKELHFLNIRIYLL